jgi:hypothetical protein
MPYQHDREFYRLPYPPAAAPQFRADDVHHRVVDIGEGGFRYALASGSFPAKGDTVKGVLTFPEAEEDLEVEGVVVRVRDGEIAVHCNARAIPLGLVLREQRRLRRHYPFRE